MKILLGFISAAVLLLIFFFITVSIGSLAIASSNSWIIGGNFSDAWSLCWDRKFIVFCWSLLFLFMIAIPSSFKK